MKAATKNVSHYRLFEQRGRLMRLFKGRYQLSDLKNNDIYLELINTCSKKMAILVSILIIILNISTTQII